MAISKPSLSDRLRKSIKHKDGAKDNNLKGTQINPLAWGVMFFSFWLSLKSLSLSSKLQQGVAWFMLGCTVAAGILIIPKMREAVEKQSQTIIMLVEEIAVLAYFIGWISPLKDLKHIDLAIALAVGYFWVIVIIGGIVAKVNVFLLRWLFVGFVLVAIAIQFIGSGINGSWPLIPILAGVLLAVFKPHVFKGLSLAS
jgi:hypothetical protein